MATTTTPVTNNPTVTNFAGGANSVAGRGATYRIAFGGAWAAGDTFIFDVETTSGPVSIGQGIVSGTVPTFAFTYKEKQYFLAGTDLFFSALEDPTQFNDLTQAGNGFEELASQFGDPENQVAIAIYQGRLAISSRRTTQIWAVDPDPANNDSIQTLSNVGTPAKESMQAVGDMDDYLLMDSGIRSIRVRDASNNAMIADIGTPIDAIVQAILATLTDAEIAIACGVVDPSANRYWLYIPGHAGAQGLIYNFSYFPNDQVSAWGTYNPTYQAAIANPAANYTASQVTYTGLTAGAQYVWVPGANEVSFVCGTVTLTKAACFIVPAAVTTAVVTGTAATAAFTGALSLTTFFAPDRFQVLNGRIYCRSGNNVFLYGGASGVTYDGCKVTSRIPYLDGEQPATAKVFTAMDASFEGTFSINFSGDYQTDVFKNVYNNTIPSFRLGSIPLNQTSTHIALEFVETGIAYARMSVAGIHFQGANEK